MTFNINKRTKNLLLVIFLPLIIWMLALGVNDLNKRMTEFTCPSDTIVVEHYDTIWAIVQRNCEGNMSAAVDAVVDVYGSSIQIGQRIFLPRNQDCELRLTDGGQVLEDC